jgi:hypothetical protein
LCDVVILLDAITLGNVILLHNKTITEQVYPREQRDETRRESVDHVVEPSLFGSGTTV